MNISRHHDWKVHIVVNRNEAMNKDELTTILEVTNFLLRGGIDSPEIYQWKNSA